MNTFKEGVFIKNDFLREFSSTKVLDTYFAFSGDSQASQKHIRTPDVHSK